MIFDTYDDDKESNVYNFLLNNTKKHNVSSVIDDEQDRYYNEIKQCLRGKIVMKKVYESGKPSMSRIDAI